jgi:hypothetical protein
MDNREEDPLRPEGIAGGCLLLLVALLLMSVCAGCGSQPCQQTGVVTAAELTPMWPEVPHVEGYVLPVPSPPPAYESPQWVLWTIELWRVQAEREQVLRARIDRLEGMLSGLREAIHRARKRWERGTDETE